MKNRTPNAIANTLVVMTMTKRGPIAEKACPITSGISIDPALAPTINHPVTWPVSLILRPANESVVGKIGAIETPRQNVPTKTAVNELGLASIRARLMRHPARVPMRTDSGLMRATMGIVNIRPRVSAPQNRDVRYAAVGAALNRSVVA
jgi:hypothetical protein